jgi:hypothetical protein
MRREIEGANQFIGVLHVSTLLQAVLLLLLLLL